MKKKIPCTCIVTDTGTGRTLENSKLEKCDVTILVKITIRNNIKSEKVFTRVLNSERSEWPREGKSPFSIRLVRSQQNDNFTCIRLSNSPPA